ncbi:MAG: Ppx/GppA family phosphatase [Candidatus Dadabacteria bacterium]|nr:MAG: Ppx/GppA family phosphatase [Candidatus Dadabacteria bacterium]TDI99236.1 MAG: Ppx/GppA family phosphatase [Candidatus Dadabacteria bacterium]
MRIASIDIGTNTIRLLICEQTKDSALKKLYIDRVITRLGEGFSNDKALLNPKAVYRSLTALKSFSKIIREHNVNKVRAVATSVVRKSENSLEFIKRIKNETGIMVEVISGEQEAELTVSGVLNSVSIEGEYYIIFDIGGGSTEYVYVQNADVIKLLSINLGVVYLTEGFLINDRESNQDIAKLSLYIEETLERELKGFGIEPQQKISLVATAGTPTTLAAIQLGLNEYKPELVNNFVLTKDMITSTMEKLIKIPKKDRSNVIGLEKGREDIIIPGALILIETLKKFSSTKVIVSDGGVLEGIAWNLIN